MDDLKIFCCQNSDCPDYGQRGLDNLRVCFRNGPDKQRRVLACRTCQERFSERKGTPLYRGKLPEEKALSVLQHLQENCGVRQTGRLVGVNKDTVVRLAVLAGGHARELHDELVALSPPDARSPVRREVVVRGEEGEAL
jgi:LacI family transcriptional regulator